MKTPDEIKKGLGYCASDSFQDCDKCPYEGVPCNEMGLIKDALAYIQQLEEKVELYDECVDNALQLMRERDAMMADLTLVCGSESINPCLVCSHYRTDWEKPGCELNGLACIWCWRGVHKDDQYREN